MRSEEQLNHLLAKFNSAELSKADWTHEAHLVVGMMHVQQFEFYDAICRMRAGIISLNRSHGTDNTGQKGYHETLTIFWLTVLDLYRRKFNLQSHTEVVNTFLTSKLAIRELPFFFYEKEKVLSSRYRSQFIPPDKLALEAPVIYRLLF